MDIQATIQLPSGIVLKYLDLYYYDTNAAADLYVEFDSFTGGAFGAPPGGTPIGTVSSTGRGGYGYSSSSIDYTVNNDVAFEANGAQLVLFINFPATDGSLRFKAVDIWYQRQVSPDPAFATFADVPV